MILLSLFFFACVSEPEPLDTPSCNSCHGGEDNAAPPKALGGETDTSYPGVGAHQSHLNPKGNFPQALCSDCHLVPIAMKSPGHIDTSWPAEIKWGEIVKVGGRDAIWDRDTLTCSDTHCHSGSGGTNPTPIWNVVDGTQTFCGTCHGLPPPAPHPQVEDCASCHGSPHPQTHIDGKVTFAGDVPTDTVPDTSDDTGDTTPGLPCDTCHGQNGQAAPPLDTLGNSDTTLNSVGAHASHMNPSDRFDPIACSECHIVPATMNAPGHIDTLPAEVVFGPLASTNANPSWNPATGTCSDVHCHGANSTGGRFTEPNWTLVDGSQIGACASCHGFPPEGGHPPSPDFNCHNCHSNLTPTKDMIDPTLHNNGVTDL